MNKIGKIIDLSFVAMSVAAAHVAIPVNDDQSDGCFLFGAGR